ncbi:hypothetical protein WN943_014973 [Citrus x changshan-huyou]
MCFYAAKNEHSYKEALAAINQLTSKFHELFEEQRTSRRSHAYGPQTNSRVLDPVVQDDVLLPLIVRGVAKPMLAKTIVGEHLC